MFRSILMRGRVITFLLALLIPLSFSGRMDAATGESLGARGTAVASPVAKAAVRTDGFEFFEPLERYDAFERYALLTILAVAIAGLLYAWLLVDQVVSADRGSLSMQSVAAALREGADAYLSAQFRKIVPLMVVITFLLVFTKRADLAFGVGRAAAFFAGAVFSGLVGYVGMRLATIGNLRVAAAAQNSYGAAMRLSYRTGAITGMLTDGLGLLGGACIFLIYGVRSYEVLLGFAFGGTLLSLFMRVGGGIYTKAADVGADLVGKIEADLPEDDPRNAATIADNVGDNVGHCTAVAADFFESYEVTLVAAMILGLASFGHKGAIFPLLVRGVGVLASIISTYAVRARPLDTSVAALRSVHSGFWISASISLVCIALLGASYLHIDDAYLGANPQAAAGYRVLANKSPAGIATPNLSPIQLPLALVRGVDPRPIACCMFGLVLAIVLNGLSRYYTGVSQKPVKSLILACHTGDATNVLQGLALGYEAAVASTVAIAVGIALATICFRGCPPVFVAYGTALAGIGMLTLTGNTIAMNVFGPVADNAKCVGEMAYDRRELGEERFLAARQILSDLDAVGNTTKAETRGLAATSAMIAAASMFASYIVVLSMGSEDQIVYLSPGQFNAFAQHLTLAQPAVLIGLLIGGVVPWLFSSMLIRAVGRAAFYVIKECRLQLNEEAIWTGTKRPNYGRVVDICTSAAQAELLGPAVLAVASPLFIGLAFGPYALGGFLAGAILSGVLLGIFMVNAGGAWDIAKTSIESEPSDPAHNIGKGSPRHKAAVTGDTIGDPLKDTAGPAINPLLKVMTMVSMLALAPLILPCNMAGEPIFQGRSAASIWIGAFLAVMLFAMIVWAIAKSKIETAAMRETGRAI